MKKLLIVIALFVFSCSEEEKDIKPDPSMCPQIIADYKKLEKEIEVYRNMPEADRAVLADMRRELQKLADAKNVNCI